MKKFLLTISLSTVLFSNQIFAQSEGLVKKLATNSCPCLEQAVKENKEGDFKTIYTECITATFVKYQKEISAETKGGDPQKMGELGRAMGEYQAKNCPAFMTLFSKSGASLVTNNANPFDTTAYKTANCKDLLDGKFVTEKSIMNGQEVPTSDPSAYSIAKAGVWTDYTENNKYKTESKMVLLNTCKYELTLSANNNPMISNMMKIGEKYQITLLGVDKKNPKKYYIQFDILGMTMYQIIIKK